jgi:tetratricopeptide (TPR) repeat protein
MGNIRSIVSLALLDGPPSLTFGQALFSYANFQCFTQPSLDPLKQLIDMKDWDHQFDAELRVKLIWLLGKIYQITKFPKECRDCFERARLLAKDANLPVAHACCLRDIGNFYSHRRDHATACTMLESAEKEFKLADTDSARGLAAACRRLIGGAKLALSHSDETLEYLKDVVLSLREFPGQRLSLAYALLDLAICHSRRSEHEEAISHAEQGYSMMQGLGWVQGDAQCLTLFAHVLCRAGQEEQAIALLKETVALHTCLGDRCQMADAYETMGMFYRKICQKEGFEMAFSRAIQLYDDLGMIESKADCLAGLALGERNVHDYLKGLEYDREARAIYLSQGSPSKAARCLMFECNALMVRKLVPHQELLAMFKQAREELLAAGDKDNAGWVMVTIAVCYYAAQEVEEGRAAAEVGLKELEDIGKHERAETGRRILQSIGYQPVTSFDAK